MTWLLRPGVGLARRDAAHLQLGIDPPRRRCCPTPGPCAGCSSSWPTAARSPRSTPRPRRCSSCWSPPGWSWRPTRPPAGSSTGPAAGSGSRPPTAFSRGCCDWSARPASASRGRRRSRRWRSSGARVSRHAGGSTTGCGPVRRTWWSGRVPAAPCSAPTSYPAPPPACAASTPTSASTTRGAPWWSSRSPRPHRCGRPSPIRRCARSRSPGRCATSRRGRRAASRPRGRPRWRSTPSRRPSRRTGGTCTAAAPGPRTSSTWRPPG